MLTSTTKRSVDSCLKMCGLEDLADAIIETLNIEYRRRTSIAIELAAQPKHLLFLDEPLSGLDSRSALAIIALLRDLSNLGQAILVSLKRSSSEVFSHFDQVLVMGKGWKTVFFGDIGPECESVMNYFESNGAHQCYKNANP